MQAATDMRPERTPQMPFMPSVTLAQSAQLVLKTIESMETKVRAASQS
jgi:hypothetical protein